MLSLSVLFAASVLLGACGGGDPRDQETVLYVSAAASLKDSLEQIAQNYEKSRGSVRIRLNFGSSGTLQQQIEQGAPADLFLSAGQKQMDRLLEKGLIRKSDPVLTGELVLIVRSDFAGGIMTGAKALEDPAVRHIAIGEPDTVPAGFYARQALTNLGLWDKLAPKLVRAKDVRHVLTLVATGNADAGIVYRTDVGESDAVTLVYAFPPETHDPIVYPFGIAAHTKHPAEAEAFLRYLRSDEAMQVFRAFGFRPS